MTTFQAAGKTTGIQFSHRWGLALACLALPLIASMAGAQTAKSGDPKPSTSAPSTSTQSVPAPSTPAQATAAQPGPAELIEIVVRQVLKELDAHREDMHQQPQKIRKLVDDLMLPHFDTEYAARQVLGQHWRAATPEQRKRFIAAFYQSLLQSYGEALLDFTPDRLTVLPYKEDPNDKERATVRTEIRRDNGARVPVHFKFRKTEAGWKAWDVVIEGISYVVSFRTDFSKEINSKGLDALIARMEKLPTVELPETKPAASNKPESGAKPESSKQK